MLSDHYNLPIVLQLFQIYKFDEESDVREKYVSI
jgi:hypothetical protein